MTHPHPTATVSPERSPFLGAPSYPVPPARHGLQWLKPPASPSAPYVAEDFGAPAAEYRAARQHVALFDRSARGRLVLTGADRKAWLHNLTTNAINDLVDHTGVYAFATNAKGRILFDLNVLALPDSLWLDLDRQALDPARAHFDRFLFTEDVLVRDATSDDARLAVYGPQSAEIAAKLGVGDLHERPPLSLAALPSSAWLVRSALGPLPGFELIVPVAQAARWWETLVGAGAQPAGRRVFETLRIEAARPALGGDLEDNVLPAETGQRARAVNDDKGCYIGHEIIERMRSRGILAKRLVQIRLPHGQDVNLPADLVQDGVAVGRLTSLVRHPVAPDWIGLGYLKTPVTNFAGLILGDPPQTVTISEVTGADLGQ